MPEMVEYILKQNGLDPQKDSLNPSALLRLLLDNPFYRSPYQGAGYCKKDTSYSAKTVIWKKSCMQKLLMLCKKVWICSEPYSAETTATVPGTSDTIR